MYAMYTDTNTADELKSSFNIYLLNLLINLKKSKKLQHSLISVILLYPGVMTDISMEREKEVLFHQQKM